MRKSLLAADWSFPIKRRIQLLAPNAIWLHENASGRALECVSFTSTGRALNISTQTSTLVAKLVLGLGTQPNVFNVDKHSNSCKGPGVFLAEPGAWTDEGNKIREPPTPYSYCGSRRVWDFLAVEIVAIVRGTNHVSWVNNVSAVRVATYKVS